MSGQQPARPASQRRVPTGVALLAAGMLLFLASGQLGNKDEVGRLMTALSLINGQGFAVEIGPNTLGGSVGRNNLYFTPFEPAAPVLAAPFVWLGMAANLASGPSYWPSVFAALPNIAITAITAGIAALFALELGASAVWAWLLALITVFGTVSLPYADSLYAEPLAALLILLAAERTLAFARSGTNARLLSAALAAGALAVVKLVTVALWPGFVLAWCYLLWQRGLAGRKRAAFAIAAALAAGLILAAGYNVYRFGSPLKTGYQPHALGEPRTFSGEIPNGLRILLLSPGKSLFLYAPAVLAALPLLAGPLRRKLPWLAALIAAQGLTFLLVIAKWSRPEGGYCFGPRLLLPVIPLLFAPLALAWEHGRLARWGAAALGILGFAINLAGAVTPFPLIAEGSPVPYYADSANGYDPAFNPAGAIRAWASATNVTRHLFRCANEPGARVPLTGYLLPRWPFELDWLPLHLACDGWPPSIWLAGPALGATLASAGAWLLRSRRAR